MLTNTPQYIIDEEERLLQSGVSKEKVNILKNHIEKLIASGTKNSLPNISDVEDIMQRFAKRYHDYITEYQAVIAADQFKKDLIAALSSLPVAEVNHMANKIITTVSHLRTMSPDMIYGEVLQLIAQNPKNTKHTEVFHTIIDFYVDRIMSAGIVEQNKTTSAWTSLDEIARLFTSNKEFLQDAKPEKLNRKALGLQKAFRTIVQGIQTRKTETIRKGWRKNFIQNSEVGEMIDRYLWDIEQSLN